jgi:hypothetical protein
MACAGLATLALASVSGAVSPHFTEEPVCTVIATTEGPAIQCLGGKVAGLGGEPEAAQLVADLACMTRSGANKPGGHLQSDTVPVTARHGHITLPALTTTAAECPPGLVPVVGPLVTLVIVDAAGEVLFTAQLPVE